MRDQLAAYAEAVQIESTTPKNEWVNAKAIEGTALQAVLEVDRFEEHWPPSTLEWGRRWPKAKGAAIGAVQEESADEAWRVAAVADPKDLPSDAHSLNAFFKDRRRLCVVSPDFLKGLRWFAGNELPSRLPETADVRRLVQDSIEAGAVRRTNAPTAHFSPSQAAVASRAGVPLLAIVGPPGTGKTYTLGRMLAARLIAHPDLRVLAVSTAHVAVDQLAEQVYDAYKELTGTEPKEGEILRARSPRKPELYDENKRRNLLVWHDSIREIAQKIRAKKTRKWATNDKAQALNLDVEIRALEAERDAILSLLIRGARIVLTSITHARERANLMRPELFDTIAFDEAGMVSLAALSFWALQPGADEQSFWFAGDPQQLEPIVNYAHWKQGSDLPAVMRDRSAQERLDGQRVVDHWFSDTVYDIVGSRHPATAALAHQRRMAKAIRKFVSKTMYEPAGYPALQDFPGFTAGGPLLRLGGQSRPLMLVDYSSLDEARYRQRWDPYDKRTPPVIAAWVLQIHRQYPGALELPRDHEEALSILILVRYRRQQSLVRSEVRKVLGGKIPRNVSISTVHKAQGSEADLVIFDPVTSTPNTVTNADDQKRAWRGEKRLVNVALSRAKRQVIVFAHRGSTFLRNHEILGALETLGNAPWVPVT